MQLSALTKFTCHTLYISKYQANDWFLKNCPPYLAPIKIIDLAIYFPCSWTKEASGKRTQLPGYQKDLACQGYKRQGTSINKSITHLRNPIAVITGHWSLGIYAERLRLPLTITLRFATMKKKRLHLNIFYVGVRSLCRSTGTNWQDMSLSGVSENDP